MSTKAKVTNLSSCERDMGEGFISFGSFSVFEGVAYSVYGPSPENIKGRVSALFMFSYPGKDNTERPCITFVYHIEGKPGADDIFKSCEFSCGCVSSNCEEIFMKINYILSMTNAAPKEVQKAEIETALKNIGFDFTPIQEHLLFFSK